MKVLKNNYKYDTYVEEVVKNYPKKMICEYCGSELEYEKSDIRIGTLGCAIVDCPCCGKDNMVDGEAGIELTKHNVEFPVHFFHTSKDTGAVDCCDNENVRKYINQAINYFRTYKDENSWFCCTGNLYINVSRWDGDENYWVVVSNNYYDTYIPFEKEDYNNHKEI